MSVLQSIALAPRLIGETLAKAVGRVVEMGHVDEDVSLTQESVDLAGRPKRKWYRTPRTLGDVTSICLHITDVRGGFGARRSDVERHIADGATDEHARCLAQADRFLVTPYHAVSARALVLNLPPSVVSWHGHGANRYSLGYAIDVGSGEAIDPEREAERFGRVVRMWAQRCPSLRYVETHRQHSAMRGGDPGATVCQALAPAISASGLQWRPDHVTGSGRPMPLSWLRAST